VTAKKPVKPTAHAKPAKAKTTVRKAKASKKASKTVSSKAKASAAAKHEAHVKHLEHLAHLAHIGQPVAFGIGDHLPVCAFEAVAASLRLAGARVHGDDVGELWHLLGEPEAVPVGEALAAAALFGLAGFRPGVVKQAGELAAVGHAAVDQLLQEHVLGHLADDIPEFVHGGQAAEYFHPVDAAQLEPPVDFLCGPVHVHGLILSVDVPGPHAVLATADGWWSWGELYDPWPCRVTGAWAVSWS
jgi:hypothetical protein